MLIGLLTDFGTRDSYVAAMKGVIASRCTATIVDLTHEIASFDVFEGAWFLRRVLHHYPGASEETGVQTIIVAVVDPGVGTERRIIAARNAGQIVLAPDNGLASFFVRHDSVVHSIENERFFLPDGSRTFHGRDRFAPVAAALANGIEIDELGPRITTTTLVPLDYEHPLYEADRAQGSVILIDRFGNAVTDLEASRTPDIHEAVLTVGSHRIDRAALNYANAPDGPFLIVGSDETIEISIRNRSATRTLGIERGTRVEIRRRGA